MSSHFSLRPISYLGLLPLLALIGCRQTTEQARNSTRPSSTRKPSRTSSVPSYRPTQAAGTASSSNEGNLLLGNPSKAGSDDDNYLLEKPQYSLSYNRKNGGPNWVAWHTDASDLGDTDRGKFRPDTGLPADWRISPNDYKNSGYDRGHVCPSGDRTNSRDNNDATFYMSNMMPQTGELNRHVWADLENYLRDQIRAGNEVYEIAGPAGNAGTIADGKVVIPRMCWKIAVIIPEGKSDWTRITAKSRVIAVAMPNTPDKKLESADWRSFLVSPKKIQDSTRLDFFNKLSPKVKSALEQKVDTGS